MPRIEEIMDRIKNDPDFYGQIVQQEADFRREERMLSEQVQADEKVFWDYQLTLKNPELEKKFLKFLLSMTLYIRVLKGDTMAQALVDVMATMEEARAKRELQGGSEGDS